LIGDLLVAFAAGAVSFFAPCVVPLLPAYVTYLGGAPLTRLGARPLEFQRRVLSGGVLYVLGFSFVFVCLGVAASFVGSALVAQKLILERVGGLIVIVMGLALLGWLPGSIAARRWSFGGGEGTGLATMTEKGPWHTRVAPLLLGIAFGTAWTPCVGPVLFSILTLAAGRQQVVEGGLLLAAYAAGLGLPFIVFSLLVASLPGLLRPLARFSAGISRAAGALLVVLGLLLLSGLYQSLTGYLAQPFTLR